VEYKPGPSQRFADELSRMETKGYSHVSEAEDSVNEIPCLIIEEQNDSDELFTRPVLPLSGPLVYVPDALDAISLDELLKAQAEDPWCRDLVQQLGQGITDTRPPGLLFDEEGALCCASHVHEDLPPRWMVPATLRERVCVLSHFSKSAGHPGISKMSHSISRLWYWPNMVKYCTEIVRRRPNCVAKQFKRGPKKSTPLTIFVAPQRA
jgi:hypothetical protein